MFENDVVVIIIVGGLVLVYQAFVSSLMWRCRFFEPRQRWIQLLLIWLFPVLGALVCHAVVQTHSRKELARDSLLKHYDEFDEYGHSIKTSSSRGRSDSGAEVNEDE